MIMVLSCINRICRGHSIALALAVLSVADANQTWADSYEWANPTTGAFDEATNWNRLSGTGSFPVAGDSAAFNEAGSYEVLFDSPEETGVLNLENGDVVFRGMGGPQTYTITGGNQDVVVAVGTLSLGGDGEALDFMIGDDLTVRDNGTLNVRFDSLLDADGAVSVGQVSGTTSSIVVDGMGSELNFANNLNLGSTAAEGILALQNDATGVISGNVKLGSVITNGATGRLNVLSGATLETGDINVVSGLLLGSNLTGEVTVDGRNSELTMTGASTLNIGSGGQSASVTVSDAAEFRTGDGGVIIGNGGTLTVDGTAAISVFQTVFAANGGLTLAADAAVVVDGGFLRVVSGDLDNTAGGTLDFRYGIVQVTAGAFIPNDTTFTIASQTVDETLQLSIENGATWSNATSITVGNSHAGTLQISGSGSVTTGTLTINENGSLFMGFSAQLNTASATVVGTASIRSSGFDNPTWTNTGNLTVSGELTVRDGGVLDVDQLIFSGDGEVVLDGGSLVARRIFEPFDFRRGSVTLTADIQIGIGTVLHPFPSSLNLGPGQHVSTPETTRVRRFHSLALSGGSLTTNALVLDSGSELHFQSGTLELTGGSLSGLSHLTVPTGGEFRAVGNHAVTVLGAPGSTIVATGDLTLGDATEPNGFGSAGNLDLGSHTVVLEDANDVVFDSLALVTLGQGISPGTLAAANGLTLDFGGNITGHGTLDTPDDPLKPTIINGSVVGKSAVEPLTLSGYVKGVGTLDNVVITGTDAPGFSPATVFRGSVSYTSALQIEIGGLEPGSEFDQLNHVLGDGIADLGGALHVALINGFSPSAGDSFEIITASSVVDTFDELSLPDIGSLAWGIVYGVNDVVLNVVAPISADFDEDGDVDGVDLLTWQRGFGVGVTVAEGDADGNGVVDAADLTLWESQLGISPLSGLTVVPEPSTVWLGGLTAVGFLLRKRRCGLVELCQPPSVSPRFQG